MGVYHKFYTENSKQNLSEGYMHYSQMLEAYFEKK